MRFCLQLDKMSRICAKEFLELNWLNVHDKYQQFIVSDIFKSCNNQCPDYFNEIFCPIDDNGVPTRKLPFRKSKLEMQSLSYIGPSTWNKLPNNLNIVISVNFFNYTHRETQCFTKFSTRMAASSFFYKFTQLIKFYTFYYYV